MDYEEKYKEALERARELSKTTTGANYEYIFPELAESEDERIRRDCIKYLDWEYQHCPISEDRMKIKKWIAWLEKQGKLKWTKEDEDNLNTAIYFMRSEERVKMSKINIELELNVKIH